MRSSTFDVDKIKCPEYIRERHGKHDEQKLDNRKFHNPQNVYDNMLRQVRASWL
jgi:hypothetical protein